MIKLSKIKAGPKNPRFIKDERFIKLCESIKALPKALKYRPIIVDANNVTIAGNMRLKALKHLGYKEVPDEWIRTADDFTPEEIKRFSITDNVGFGEWDYEMLGNEWDPKQLEEWGLDIPEFTAPADQEDPFDDAGITNKNQYGIIVMCEDEESQETIFAELTGKGYNCKIVVT